MKKKYNFTLSDEVAQILKDTSEKSGIKMTTLIERLVVKYLKNKEYENY